MVYQNRIYLPSRSNGIEAEEYLLRYIEREFPERRKKGEQYGQVDVYSIPRNFQKTGERQAVLAEHVVFCRLHGLASEIRAKGLWMLFFHSASYAGQSFRNHRDGKLMIREHDFVLFAKYCGKHYVALVEVKSSHDTNATAKDLDVTSDAKVIKNNKRSAQHQLRDHLEVLLRFLDIPEDNNTIQTYIMWPFLCSLTRDPKHQIIKRWRDEPGLHVFEETLTRQEYFDQWFMDNVVASREIQQKHFITLLNRYIVLSCGVFVDEINEGMLALLNSEQFEILNSKTCQTKNGQPLVVHGAAGSGKTLLVLKKLEQLYDSGLLNDENRALYICYWPGIRCEVEQKLKLLGIKQFVDTARFYISQSGFLLLNKSNYKHIFMDEAEALCLSFDRNIMMDTLGTIYQKYHDANCIRIACAEAKSSPGCYCEDWGELWFLVDINQASLFLPKHSPQILKTPSIILSKVMRSTGYIFNIFKQFYANPMPCLPQQIMSSITIPEITLGHHIIGPPIYWVNTDKINGFTTLNVSLKSVVDVVIDLCATKGFKPNDICVLPFLRNDNLSPESINEYIERHFVQNAYRPRCVGEIEDFLLSKEVNDFLVSWVLKTKGVEFKVVILVMDEDDYDVTDGEDRKRTYIMASRCTCMLVIVSPSKTKKEIDLNGIAQEYPFSLKV